MNAPAPAPTTAQIEAEASAAAQTYDDVNAACPYPFDTEAGRIFRAAFLAQRSALAAAPELEP